MSPIIQSAGTIGQRLKEERRRLSLSQKALADLCKVALSTQCRYEKDECVPDANYLVTIAEVGADMVYIVTGKTSPGAIDPQKRITHLLVTGWKRFMAARKKADARELFEIMEWLKKEGVA
jgi:transcriptional regulator with XRE-family HTH domain